MSERKEIAVIGDSNTVVGFRLAGLKRIFEIRKNITEDSLKELFTALYHDPRIGIIAVTSNLLPQIGRLTTSEEQRPIIVEIPQLQAPEFTSSKEYYQKKTSSILGFGIEL